MTFLDVKKAKIKIYKKSIVTIVKTTLESLQSKFQVNRSIFERGDTIFVIFQKSREIAILSRKWIFAPLFYHIFARHAVKILGQNLLFSHFNKTNLVLSNCKILDILKHFWTFQRVFCAFQGPFSAIFPLIISITWLDFMLGPSIRFGP